MKTAVLFSGGKDSGLALKYALEYTDVKCLITIVSDSDESYMFHVPNIKWTEKQAEVIGIPIIIQKTAGEKEEELLDLEKAIKTAIRKYDIKGVVTGAIESVYQASRVQELTNSLGIECFNPLWQKDQFELLNELVENGENKFEIIIVGVFGEGLDGILGRTLDKNMIEELRKIHKKLKINPAGEGGEYESFILNAPYFKKKLKIKKTSIKKEPPGGKILIIEDIK
jgi:ABC transporter with metal-binding/Fe-S-binding domain ATP-binding protein